MEAGEFLSTALQDYKVVGALAETSPRTIRHIARRLTGCRYTVEFGPGPGGTSRAFLETLPRDGRLISIELQPNFFPYLKEIDDPRFTLIMGDAVRWSDKLRGLGLPRLDAVVSGIPFTFLPPEAREALVKNTASALDRGGKFIVYQLNPAVLFLLRKYFSRVRMRLSISKTPYFIFSAEK